MKKTLYSPPSVWPYELHLEGVVCASETDNAGLPGVDFNDDLIVDPGIVF